jgi:hypothetical protein
VVISRYHRVAGYDWLAIPVLPYLYAVDNPAEMPTSPDQYTIEALRDRYRRIHLEDLIPDDGDDKIPSGDWVQLVGASYDRKIYGYEFRTSKEQDDRLIREFNSRTNRTHFNLFLFNCADFSRAVIDSYYPKAVHRSIVMDAGITTPKQLAKSLVNYSKRHPDLELARFVIPQVADSRPRSGKVRGVLESVVMSKKYVVPIAVLHPFIAGGLAAAYFARGRFDPGRHAPVLEASAWSDSPIIAGKLPAPVQNARSTEFAHNDLPNGGGTREETAVVNVDTSRPAE